MSESEERSRIYGAARLAPRDPVVAGTFTTWTITYTVGSLGMDDGSTLKIASNMSSDWGRPQFSDPSADNYATVETSGEATVEGKWDPGGHVRPLKDAVVIDVFDGSLAPNETITLTLGDTSAGSPGHQAQTFPEDGFELAVLVDSFESGEFIRLTDELAFDVIPGAASRMHAFLPSTASPGDEAELRVRIEDFWGNTAADYDGTISVKADDSVDVAEEVEISSGIGLTQLTVTSPGTYRLELFDENRDLETTTNPLVCGDHDRQLFWGDIHGQSGETVGTGTIDRYFSYLRDNAHLDFGSHAGNDFQITDSFWETIRNTVREYNSPHEFVTFLCYEWSPNTPIGGDHNVYFRDDESDIHRSSSWQIAEEYEKHEGTYPIEDLYATYDGRDDVLIIPHQGGRPATLDYVDADLTPFVEIASVWGIFEWFGHEALERGHDVGFVGGSDDHTGRPGASYPTNKADWSFPIKGPVMAAHADGLTRSDLWAAFVDRRVYATTGARIYLDVWLDDAPMGSEVAVDDPPEFVIEASGTAPIRRIDLFRGSSTVASESYVSDDSPEFVEILWSGARSKDRHKVQDWSGIACLTNGRIVAIEEVGFDHPTQGVTESTDTHVRWDGATAGNRQGLRLEIDSDPRTVLSVHTDPVSGSVRIGDLGERSFDAGPVERKLSIRKNGRSDIRDVVTVLEDDPASGRYPYYVRVTQADGETAWSSPIFVRVS